MRSFHPWSSTLKPNRLFYPPVQRLTVEIARGESLLIDALTRVYEVRKTTEADIKRSISLSIVSPMDMVGLNETVL